MNREKKESLSKHTVKELADIEAKKRHESWYDGQKYPELFIQWYDAPRDRAYLEGNISSLSKEIRELIRYKYERGYYPERLHYLVIAELKLKHPEE